MVRPQCADFAAESLEGGYFAAQKRFQGLKSGAKTLKLCVLRLQDPFGNYVVQYVLELDIADASIAVMNNLFGHYADLAQQKFSSNVVEKCLKLGGSQLNEVRRV